MVVPPHCLAFPVVVWHFVTAQGTGKPLIQFPPPLNNTTTECKRMNSQRGLRQLLFGQVQGVVECGDAVGMADRALW